MIRKIVAVWVSLAMLFGFVVIMDVVTDIIPSVKASTLYVNTTGSNGAYMNIQDAINASEDGDTVFVYNGIYYENVVVNKTINLTGEDRDMTIINGSGLGDVVYVNASGVNISKFTLINSGTTGDPNYDSGIELNKVQNCSIFNNIATDNMYGIRLFSSSNNSLSGNNFSKNRNFGIRLLASSNNNTITNNTALSNVNYGIYIKSSSNYNVITNNKFLNNNYGILVESSLSNDIKGNNASNNSNYGIYIFSSSKNNLISNNHVFNNKIYGIWIISSSKNIIINNNVSNNGNYGVSLWASSHDNIVSSNNISSHNWYGIHIGSSSNNNITNNHVSKNIYGIYVDSMNNNISNNNISSNSNCGLYLTGSYNNTILNNSILFNDNYGIYVYNSNENNISGNNFVDDGIFILGNQLTHFNSHVIPNNNFVNGNPLYYYKNSDGFEIDGISVGQLIIVNCTDIYVKNLQIYNTDVGMEVAYSKKIMINGNNVSMNNEQGIYFYSSSLSNITSNNFVSNGKFGIVLRLSMNNSITRNNISLHDDTGIYLSSSINNTVNSNIVISQNLYGIDLFESSNNNIIKNTLFNNKYGIRLVASSITNIVSYNIVSLSDMYGISVWSSSIDNQIMGNTILNNNFGIRMDMPSNFLYHNNFINNTNQAFDSTDNNQWDSGYPNGGNYWSDYFGIDNFKGPDQDTPGSDGIGDTNYSIDSDSVDNYPLMEPIENYTILDQGWNLISVPLIQKDQNLIKVLEMIDGYYDAVQWYDITDLNESWKHNKVGKSYGNDLTELTVIKGFWIHIIQSKGAILLHNGTQSTSNQTIQLYPGWNMVGYPSLSNHNRTIGLNNLTFGTDVNAVQ